MNQRTSFKITSFLTVFTSLLGLLFAHLEANAAELTVISRAHGDNATIPARIHLTGPDGKPVRPLGNLPFWHDHTSSPGKAAFSVATGRYSLTVERGPEWTSENSILDISSAESTRNVEKSLRRIVDLSAEGWWSGEMHIHRPVEQIELLMRTEDLHFGQLISWWNASNPWTNTSIPSPSVKTFDTDRFVNVMGGEDERDGGALLFFSLNQPIDIASGRQHFPTSLSYARQAKAAGAWIDIEKPFWWDVPMWIANGIGDSIGLANNHMYRSGVYPNEAWGRPRNISDFPGNLGNGFWSQTIYYHLLNSGIRIPPSAGSASGVLPNPPGYNRVYAQFDGQPSMEKWLSAVKAGRVFVSNGPLLRVKANGHHPGHLFKGDSNSLEIALDGRLDSRDPIQSLELVQNGRTKTISLPARITIDESGWFLIRAITTMTNTFRFASTGPFYVELKSSAQSPRQRESSEFFLNWCHERIARLSTNGMVTAEQRPSLLKPWLEARAFWLTRLDAARPDGTQHRNSQNLENTSFWLQNMLEHSFNMDEMRQVLGWDPDRIAKAIRELPPRPRPAAGLTRVLPYPGGRHPRLGFLEGAIAPQRDTKISVFAPWDPKSYVVIDVPEAIWSNLGLTYLAHAHIDTVWDKQGIKLPPLEWTRHADGSLTHERNLPNGIAFGARVQPGTNSVDMDLWLRNGTNQKLTDLRIQNCVMLKGAEGFTTQTKDHTVIGKPFVSIRSSEGNRWIITAWENCDRPWANPPVPCIHSDPKFPDLAPGETGKLHGSLWFYEGNDLPGKLAELKAAR